MPVSLISEIKKLAEKNHFLDTSEVIRSLLRDNWILYTKPSTRQKVLRDQISRIADKNQIDALKKTLKLLEEMHEN